MGVIDALPRPPAGRRRTRRRLTLGEGSTPLIRSRALGERLGVELHFKFEGMNPTGSFKDRGMAVAVAKAVEDGRRGDRLRVDRATPPPRPRPTARAPA